VKRSWEKIDKVTELYMSGLSTRQIAEKTGVSKSVVGTIVKQAGISRDRSTSQILGCKRNTRVPFTWSFFPLTAEKAWLLGLIYGDGSLSNQGFTITITSGDRDVIDNINALFDNALEFATPTSTYWSIRINSVRLWKELKEHFGLTPNKSRILLYPSIDDSLRPHFIRGLLDSDGCWRADKRNPQPKLLFGYVSLSRDFVESLRTDLIKYVGVSSKRTVREGRGFVLIYSNIDALKIGHWLYANSSSRDRCKRKFDYWSLFAEQ
jgi:hypothetical protein